MTKETKQQRAQAKAVNETMAMSFADFSADELAALYQHAQSNRMLAGAKNWEGNRDVMRHRQYRCMELSLGEAMTLRGIPIPPPIKDWRAYISEAIQSQAYGYHERKAAERELDARIAERAMTT